MHPLRPADDRQAALETFDPRACTDQALDRQFPRWRRQGAELMGEDAPIAQSWRLERLIQQQRADAMAVNHALHVAEQYPNNRDLVLTLTRAMRMGVAGKVDFPLLASLAISGLCNRFQDACDDRHDPVEDLGATLVQMGRYDMAASLLPRYPARNSWELYFTLRALCGTGRFVDAVDYYNAHADQVGSDPMSRAGAANAVLAAVACHDWDTPTS